MSEASTEAPQTQPNRSPALEALWQRAFEAQGARRLDEADAAYRDYLAQDPMSISAWVNFGVVLRGMQRFEGSIACARRALTMAPGNDVIRNNLANSLNDAGHYVEALEIREALLAQTPRDAGRLAAVASSLTWLKRHEEVIARVDQADREGWADARPRIQRGFSLLALGEHGRGFADLEYRHEAGQVDLPDPEPGTLWRGGSLDGRHLVLTPEQGLGDAIAMARFVPQLQRLGARKVTFAVRKPVIRLLQGTPGADQVVDRMERSERDLYVPLPSLPARLDFDGPPPPPAKLTLPDDSVARAKKRTAPFRDLFRVGIVWTGSLTNAINPRRALSPLTMLRFGSIRKVQLFSLYKGDAHADFIASGAVGPIVDACGDDRDLADGAAMAAEMDLVISADTGIAHAAASLGCEVWILNAWESFWYWGEEDRTPWYPSVRLFHQTRRRHWDDVLDRVDAALRERVAAWEAAR
ncbi:MAG: tetratricopeptide repeat-containing glycosyltransferase family protein [Pseudomonadota bacterium]